MALGCASGLEGWKDVASAIVEQLRARAMQEYVTAAFHRAGVHPAGIRAKCSSDR